MTFKLPLIRALVLVATMTVVGLTTTRVHACTSIDFGMPYSEVLNSSKEIYLAKVERQWIEDAGRGSERFDIFIPYTGGDSWHVTVTELRVIESIKGGLEEGDSILIGVQGPRTNQQDHDFDAHGDHRFWLDQGGRLDVTGNCQILPEFSVGTDYLVLIGPELYKKSFERVDSPGDHWLDAARRSVARSRSGIVD